MVLIVMDFTGTTSSALRNCREYLKSAGMGVRSVLDVLLIGYPAADRDFGQYANWQGRGLHLTRRRSVLCVAMPWFHVHQLVCTF